MNDFIIIRINEVDVKIPTKYQLFPSGKTHKVKLLTNLRFGKLIAVEPMYIDGVRYWKCQCDCGNVSKAKQQHLLYGSTRSCGCGIAEASSSHLLSKHPMYNVWKSIHNRCDNSKMISYKYYGAKGVKVCDEWHDVTNFIYWAEQNKWRKGFHICRKGDIGDYSPENCYIATAKKNHQDRPSNKLNAWKARVIRVMKKNHGWSSRKQGKFWGVSSSTIKNVINNNIWA